MYEKGLKKTCRDFILLVFSIIIGMLTYASIFINTHIAYYEEHQYVYDKPYKILICFILLIVVTFFIRKYFKIEKKLNSKKLFIVLGSMLFIIFGFIILKYDIQPKADQLNILNCAASLRQGDYSPFLPNGYIGKCTNQAGIVIILYYLSFIFGENNYIAIQFLNIFGLILSNYCICKIAMISFHDDKIQKWVMILLFAYMPLNWYVTFVYGNIFGHAFSMLAILEGYQFFEHRTLKSFIIAFISIIVAMMLKMNYMIVFIAMIFFILFDIILNKRYKTILLLICFIPTILIANDLPKTFIENKTGILLDQGVPMLAYIEMGIQPSETKPGWFNGYNWNVYTDNNCDSKLANEQVKQDLKNTVIDYIKDPISFIRFMAKKMISQWCDADFQGTWIIRNSELNIPKDIYYEIFNVFESIVFLGTLAYIYYAGRHMPLHRLLLPMIFIGGFVFHMMWEAKGQYTITYFVLLIPYCVKGIMDMTDEIGNTILSVPRRTSRYNKLKTYLSMNVTKYILIITLSCTIIDLIVR